MVLDPPHPAVEFADQNAVAKHRSMILRHRLPQAGLAMREVVQLAIMRVQQQGVFVEYHALLIHVARQGVDRHALLIQFVAVLVDGVREFVD